AFCAVALPLAFDLMYRLGKDYVRPEFGIQTVGVEHDGVVTQVAIHERVEIDKPFCELRRFKRFSDDGGTLAKLKGQPAVLIVAPLSGHYATLLRDTVRSMLQGHKVFITDWKNARLVPLSQGEFHLDDYVNYVQEFIGHLQKQYGNCHVMSVCQPTVPVLAAVSLMASRGEPLPLSMTMMGGPIDARKSPTAVNNLAMQRSYQWFENNVIYRVPHNFPGAGRRVYPGFLQHTGFVAMNPDRHASSHWDYFKDLIKGDDRSVEAHRKFYDEYNAVLDMDADYYLDTIRTVFQDFKLVNGTWDVKSAQGQIERVRPQDITGCKLLTVEGELDDISGSGQTRAALDLCSGIPATHKGHYEVKGAGHYGIFSGKRWREMVYPQVRDFIAQAAGVMPNSGQKLPLARKKSAQSAAKSVASKNKVAATKPAAKKVISKTARSR
ncbi:MAG: polyhydroxyalkanoate depolymerase, partial [Brachymonas sp.]|nr:polyhydroxyalkanoate depolymerase [Brachymonas sp.]